MNLRTRIWWFAALLFSLVNLAGAIYAAFAGEQFHTDMHVALLLVGGYMVWRLSPKRVSNY
jgi:zinc transporter ZupT